MSKRSPSKVLEIVAEVLFTVTKAVKNVHILCTV